MRVRVGVGVAVGLLRWTFFLKMVSSTSEYLLPSPSACDISAMMSYRGDIGEI